MHAKFCGNPGYGQNFDQKSFNCISLCVFLDKLIPYPLNYECNYHMTMPQGEAFSFWFEDEEPFDIDVNDKLTVCKDILNNVQFV